jgi:hypothetical protein
MIISGAVTLDLDKSLLIYDLSPPDYPKGSATAPSVLLV